MTSQGTVVVNDQVLAEVTRLMSWNLYGSQVPHPHFEGTAVTMVNNRVKPVLGKTVAPDYEIRDGANSAIATRKTAHDIAASLRFLGIK